MPLRVHIIDTESEMETEVKSCLHKKKREILFSATSDVNNGLFPLMDCRE
jgi:hypothetical protein